MAIPQSQEHERRLHARYRVDLGAEIQRQQGASIQGQVRDICSGGLFLECSHTPLSGAPALDEECDLDISLPDDSRSVRVRAMIVRITPDGLGLRFVSLFEDAAARLARFMNQASVSARPDVPRSQLSEQALKLLRTLSEQRLPRIFDIWIASLIDGLWNYSETTTSDSDRSAVSSEIGLLYQAQQSRHLSRQIREAIGQSFDHPGREAMSPDAQQSSLELLDQDVFESWLLKSELNARLEQELHEPLGTLRAQAAQLSGHPLQLIEPEHLIDVLDSQLGQLGLSDLVLRIGLRVLRASLSDARYPMTGALANFYQAIALGWSRLGIEAIEPASRHPSKPRSQEDRPEEDSSEHSSCETGASNAPAHAAEAPPAAPGDPRAATTPQVAPPPETSASAPSPSALQLGQLFDSLVRAHADPASGTASPQLAPLQRWLHHLDTHQADPLTLPRTHARVSLTDTLVSDILADQSTPSQLKGVLERIPGHLLSMALTHPGALLDEHHPLVQVFDQIDRLARLLPNGARDDAGHQQQFEQLIERLVVTDADDFPSLEALSARLSDLNERLDQQSRANRAHWVSVCEIRERHRNARETVRQRINDVLTDQHIHPVCIEILDRGWRTLLETVCLTSGLDSPRWRRHWRTLWQLHLDVLSALPGTEHVIEADQQQVLLEELLDGWASIGLTPDECGQLTEHVQLVLQQIQTGQVEADVYQTFTPFLPASDDGVEVVAKNIPEADWNAASAQIDALPLGTLVRSHEHEGPVALRLIWRSQDGTRLGLTDPLAKRLISRRRSHLVKRLLRDQLVFDIAHPEGSAKRAATAALERMHSRVREHDLPDPLTGLANQNQLRAALVELLGNPEAWDRAHILGFLELDHFDLMTSQYGFTRSEQMLKLVAKLLCAQLPDARCLAYLGAGRFGVVTGIEHHDETLALGEHLRTALSTLSFSRKSRPGARRLSWSLGLKLLNGHQTLPEHHLSAVNLACLTARRQGGDRVVLFHDDDPVILKQSEQLRAWVQAEDAIRSERIRLRFQPIAPLATLELEHPAQGVHHSEILLSVYDENHQPLHLGDFIAAAEALNMMRTLDHQVIEATLRWLHEHPGQEGPLGSVAINLSGQTVGDADFAAWISARLEYWGVPARRVGFEVTETAAIVDIERAVANLEQLKALGCSLYLDDFGSGLSSYGYLKRLPVDYVKIDGSFIKDIIDNPHDQAIVRSFNDIAHFMGKQTVAEFVENAGIIALLREIGIDHVQGYAIARPAFVDEFTPPQ